MECSQATKLLTLIISDDAVRFQLHFLNIALEKSVIILTFSYSYKICIVFSMPLLCLNIKQCLYLKYGNFD